MPTDETQLAVMSNKLDRTNEDVKEIKNMLQNNFVTQDQFRPYKRSLDILGGTALLVIITAIISLALRK